MRRTAESLSDPDASAGPISSPASPRSTSSPAEDAAAACVPSRSSPTPTPSPASCTAPGLPRPPAPRPRCPSRAHGRALRHACVSPCGQDPAKSAARTPPNPPVRALTAALRAARRTAPYSPSHPNSHFKRRKRAPHPRTLYDSGTGPGVGISASNFLSAGQDGPVHLQVTHAGSWDRHAGSDPKTDIEEGRIR